MRKKRFPGEPYAYTSPILRNCLRNCSKQNTTRHPQELKNKDHWNDWMNYPLVYWPQSHSVNQHPYQDLGQVDRGFLYPNGFSVNPYENQEHMYSYSEAQNPLPYREKAKTPDLFAQSDASEAHLERKDGEDKVEDRSEEKEVQTKLGLFQEAVVPKDEKREMVQIGAADAFDENKNYPNHPEQKHLDKNHPEQNHHDKNHLDEQAGSSPFRVNQEKQVSSKEQKEEGVLLHRASNRKEENVIVWKSFPQ